MVTTTHSAAPFAFASAATIADASNFAAAANSAFLSFHSAASRMASANNGLDAEQSAFGIDYDEQGDFIHYDVEKDENAANQAASSPAYSGQHSTWDQRGSDSGDDSEELAEQIQPSVAFNHFSSSNHIRFNETSSPTLEEHAAASNMGRRRRLLSSSARHATTAPNVSDIELAIGSSLSSNLTSTSASRLSSGERSADLMQMQQQRRQRMADAHQQRMVAAQTAAATSADHDTSLWLDGRAAGFGTTLSLPSSLAYSATEFETADSARRSATRLRDHAVSEATMHRQPQQLRKERVSSARHLRDSSAAGGGGGGAGPHRADTDRLGEIFTAATSSRSNRGASTVAGAGTSGGHGGRMTALGVLTQNIKASAATQRLRETGGGLEAPFLRVDVGSSHDASSSDTGGSGRTLTSGSMHHVGSSAVRRGGGTSSRGHLMRGVVSAPSAAAAALSADSQFSAIATAMLAVDSFASRVSATDQQPRNKDTARSVNSSNGNGTAGRLRRGLAFES